VKWNAEAGKLGIRYKVFCNSLADVFDNDVPDEWRDDLFRMIRATPNLDWQLLTKRIGNVTKMHPGGDYPNVWIGATVINQDEIDRDYHKLANLPAAVRFFSIEPMLGPIQMPGGIDWVICGGESGANARQMNPDWARALRDQCQANGAAFFMKQMTKKAPIPPDLLVRQFPRPT